MPILYKWLKFASKRAPKRERERELNVMQSMVREYDNKLGFQVTDEIETKY